MIDTGHFHLLAVMNDAALNIYAQVFRVNYGFNYLVYITRSRNAMSQGNSMLTFLTIYIPTSNVGGFQSITSPTMPTLTILFFIKTILMDLKLF